MCIYRYKRWAYPSDVTEMTPFCTLSNTAFLISAIIPTGETYGRNVLALALDLDLAFYSCR